MDIKKVLQHDIANFSTKNVAYIDDVVHIDGAEELK